MERKVICFIQAFDCEHTIQQTMQSVLEQTYGNWVCFVLSNGNIDDPVAPNHSFDVIKGIAARDRRFIVLNKKRNSIDMYIPSLYQLASMFPDDYICSLDADDVYEPDFFERAVQFAEQERLDIVCCGTRIMRRKNVEASSEEEIGRRELIENMIVRGEDFTHRFISYRSFFNEMWGKLYRAGLFSDQKFNWSYAKRQFFGRFLPDTLFTFDNLSRCDGIGVLSGTSHRFYQFEQRKPTNATVMANEYAANNQKGTFPNCFAPIIKPNRFRIFYTYAVIMNFLKTHGSITRNQYEYMQAILVGWLFDFYSRTLVQTTDEKKLVEHMEYLVYHPKFDRLMQFQGSDKYNNLKDVTKRMEFCVLMRNTLAYQPVIRNRENKNHGNLPCSPITSLRIKRVCKKLDLTISMLEHR